MSGEPKDPSQRPGSELTVGELEAVLHADSSPMTVEEIRAAITAGEYVVDPDRLAMIMLHHRDTPLKSNEE